MESLKKNRKSQKKQKVSKKTRKSQKKRNRPAVDCGRGSYERRTNERECRAHGSQDILSAAPERRSDERKYRAHGSQYSVSAGPMSVGLMSVSTVHMARATL